MPGTGGCTTRAAAASGIGVASFQLAASAYVLPSERSLPASQVASNHG